MVQRMKSYTCESLYWCSYYALSPLTHTHTILNVEVFVVMRVQNWWTQIWTPLGTSIWIHIIEFILSLAHIQMQWIHLHPNTCTYTCKIWWKKVKISWKTWWKWKMVRSPLWTQNTFWTECIRQTTNEVSLTTFFFFVIISFVQIN